MKMRAHTLSQCTIYKMPYTLAKCHVGRRSPFKMHFDIVLLLECDLFCCCRVLHAFKCYTFSASPRCCWIDYHISSRILCCARSLSPIAVFFCGAFQLCFFCCQSLSVLLIRYIFWYCCCFCSKWVWVMLIHHSRDVWITGIYQQRSPICIFPCLKYLIFFSTQFMNLNVITFSSLASVFGWGWVEV